MRRVSAFVREAAAPRARDDDAAARTPSGMLDRDNA